MTIKVHGWDISLNHGAMVELTDGELSNFWYYTDLAGSAAKSKKRGHRIDPDIFKIKDKHVRQMQRLAWLEHFMDKKVLMPSMPQYVGIEDYAIRAEQGAHYLGEVGGIARILCWFRGINMRLHDPTSVKMFTAHDGTCQKDAVTRAVEKRWGMDFSSLDQPLAQPTKKTPNPKKNMQTSEDLSDAYSIAQLVWTEYQLRQGLIKLSDLHEKEVRVFNRTTKTYPINLLDREWIVNPDGVPTPHNEPVCDVCGSRKCCLAKKKK
jgi:Holliday junction resolvasome RuvABC endonuclease subunit